MSDELNKQIIEIDKLLKKEENKLCADCRRRSPSWASILFGCFVCIKCSGFHRELGTHIAKIKSINLDKWPKGVLDLYKKINNDVANEWWESRLPKDFDFKKIQNDENALQDHIRNKYERRRWASRNCIDPMSLLYQGKEITGMYFGEEKSKKGKKKDESESDGGDDEFVEVKDAPETKPSKPLKIGGNAQLKPDQPMSMVGNNPSLLGTDSGSNVTQQSQQPKKGFDFIKKTSNKEVKEVNLFDFNAGSNLASANNQQQSSSVSGSGDLFSFNSNISGSALPKENNLFDFGNTNPWGNTGQNAQVTHGTQSFQGTSSQQVNQDKLSELHLNISNMYSSEQKANENLNHSQLQQKKNFESLDRLMGGNTHNQYNYGAMSGVGGGMYGTNVNPMNPMQRQGLQGPQQTQQQGQRLGTQPGASINNNFYMNNPTINNLNYNFNPANSNPYNFGGMSSMNYGKHQQPQQETQHQPHFQNTSFDVNYVNKISGIGNTTNNEPANKKKTYDAFAGLVNFK